MLHQVGVSFDLYYDARKHKIKRLGSAAARLLGLRVRILPRAWSSVSCGRCVVSDGGLCVGLITLPEDSYRLLCVLRVIVNPE